MIFISSTNDHDMGDNQESALYFFTVVFPVNSTMLLKIESTHVGTGEESFVKIMITSLFFLVPPHSTYAVP